jgi:hypothetical protein
LSIEKSRWIVDMQTFALVVEDRGRLATFTIVWHPYCHVRFT